jgi:hypothetical protein
MTVFTHRGLSPHQFTPMSGAHQKLTESRAELKRRDAENAESKARLDKLGQLLNEKLNE